MAKERTPVPEDISAEVLYVHHNTCCICNEPARRVQVHHLDEDPTNHNPENLAVLCLICHEETQLRGGFTKKLTEQVVRRYRDEWLKRVSERRAIADQRATEKVIGLDIDAPGTQWTRPSTSLLIMYMGAIPTIYEKSGANHEELTVGEMVQSAIDEMDVTEQVLVQLSKWFPPNHFGGIPSEKYFSELISERFKYHRAISEPDGYGTGGTIAQANTANRVAYELKRLVIDLVHALQDIIDQGAFDFEAWRERMKSFVR